MNIKITTWNINSIRIRLNLIEDFIFKESPDILCLQECKSMVDQIPKDKFAELGYPYFVGRGQKSYNGIAIFSKLPLVDSGSVDFASLGHARHVCGTLENGLNIHNFYFPAGGDIPDQNLNLKFSQKLNYISEVEEWFKINPPNNTILLGDLNIAPSIYDVWDHKKLSNIVSHTPIEINYLEKLKKSSSWVDTVRSDKNKIKMYSWWSYRAKDWQTANKGRRLDHIWVSKDLEKSFSDTSLFQEARGWEKPSDHIPISTRLKL